MVNKNIHSIVVVCVLYIAAQMMADISSLRIVLVAGFSIDAGTLIYPFTFTLRDLVHKVAGIAISRTLIVMAALINLGMAFYFQFVSNLPPDLSIGEQSEFITVFSPVWRIVIASIVAEVVSEFIDGEVYQKWVNHFSHKYQWGRVLASNAVSIPIDSLLFVLIAFMGDVNSDVIFSIFIANMLVKGFITLVSIPSIYFIRGTENESHS